MEQLRLGRFGPDIVAQRSLLRPSRFFACYFFVIPLLAPTANAAQTTASVSITPVMHLARVIGEAYVFNVNIYGVKNLQAVEFTITYNASALKFCSLTQGSFFPPSPASNLNYAAVASSGFLRVNMSLAKAQTLLNGNGTLVSCKFVVANKPASSIVSTLIFSETSLVDGSGNQILCDNSGGVCFWGTLGPDPPGQGLLVESSNETMYALGDIVSLVSQVTYAGDPVSNKLVAFQILDPSSNTIALGVVMTNQNGIASMSFGIPETGSSLGEWTVFSTVELDQVVYWDSINFQVNMPSTVGGYSYVLTAQNKTTSAATSVAYSAFFALLTLALIARKPRRHFSTRAS